ncbi:MAG: hypothetical protein KF799_10380 [Bdellovibrionales bacterium]|nr:hypothetical protein [Bdellovibrionales bacterium]
MRITVVFALIFSTLGCAYKLGLSERSLPGGYTQVAIPVFKNLSQDVGIEMYFTNSLIRRFARSQVASVANNEVSPVELVGTIRQVVTEPGPAVTNDERQLRTLPDQVVLTTNYRLIVTADIILKRKSDDRVVWQGSFVNERVYEAPRIGMPIVNSANATYNQSVRNQTIAVLADEMMAEAHDRMTENF